ncbi:MAG TPA: spondin domain-containing protein [Blastocatellia bacterium]|nr:spondin domain-containing protein [Blastocatellia bacterium]
MLRNKLYPTLIACCALVIALFVPATQALAKKDRKEARFVVRIENISSPDGQTASNGTKWPFALSPGFWAVHKNEVRFFNDGRANTPNGLEMQAEDGNPSGLVNYLMGHHSSMQHGIFNTPLNGMTPGPIGPGGVYEFSITATEGQRLSLITMFGQSNDLFYSPDPDGINLFEKGQPISGDITSKFILWDAGTEVNEEPGIGPNQAPRQAAPNTGASENGKVRKAKDSTFYSQTTKLLRITITPQPQA